VNEKVEAGSEEGPVGKIRRRSRANNTFRGDRGGSRVADMHLAYNNERKMIHGKSSSPFGAKNNINIRKGCVQ